MSYYEEIFTRLSRAVTLDEVIAIRDEAEVARIKARLVGDLQTETLAADIVTRANQKSRFTLPAAIISAMRQIAIYPSVA